MVGNLGVIIVCDGLMVAAAVVLAIGLWEALRRP
jgi:hypothetical protein